MKKLALVLSFLLAAPLVSAMEFKTTVNQSGAIIIYATGDIVKGDAHKLERLIERHPQDSVIVALDSGGGLVSEAINLGFLIHGSGSRTAIYNHCASACAIVFFAGHERYMTKDSRLGVHQLKTYSGKADEASAQYWTSKVYEYGHEVNFPKEVLHVMFKTTHDKMHYLSPAEARKANVNLLK